jgi:hypothetical protein
MGGSSKIENLQTVITRHDVETGKPAGVRIAQSENKKSLPTERILHRKKTTRRAGFL